MDWTARIDAYCERVGPGLWAEPLNAVTNLAFLLAAFVLWRRLGHADLPLARAMVVLLAVIGLSSGLWHTLAQGWTGAADSLSILVFILLYLYAANRHYWGMGRGRAALGTAAFVPYTAALTPVFGALPFFEISSFYWPVPLLIAVYAALLRRRAPATARGLWIGAALLVLSLTARSLDDALCPAFPAGTHFLWHVLNAAMLGWVIEVYRRHMLAGEQAGR